MERIVAVVTWTALMGTIVLAGLVLLPMAIMLTNPPSRIDPLCGRACLAPGVTENPNITLIGAD